MKKELLALCLVSASLLADYDPYCETPPPPREPVRYEYYLSPCYSLDRAWGFSLFGDYLYWFANEPGLPLAVRARNDFIPGVPLLGGFPPTELLLVPVKYKFMGSKWSSGFRAGLGWNGSCDGWYGSAVWTFYQNRKHTSHSVPLQINPLTSNAIAGGQVLINPWMNAATLNVSVPQFQSIKGNWHLHFNQVDLELGTDYWATRSFSMHPYVGARGAFIKTDYGVTSNGLAPVNFTLFVEDLFQNKFWGVGAMAGIEAGWLMCRGLSILGSVEGALLYGRYSVKQNENIVLNAFTITPPLIQQSFTSSSSRFFGFQPVIDIFLGFSWEKACYCDRFSYTLSVGWEEQVWFQNSYRMKTVNNVLNVVSLPIQLSFGSFDTIVTNLVMGGLTVSLAIDF